MMHSWTGSTFKIRLISRVSRQPCIKMHRFASLFEFFRPALPGVDPKPGSDRPRLEAHHHLLCKAEIPSTSRAPKCTKTHHFFDLLGAGHCDGDRSINAKIDAI